MSTTASSVIPPKPATTPPNAAPRRRATSRIWPFTAFTVVNRDGRTSDGSSACSAAWKNGARQLVTVRTASTIHTRSLDVTASSGTSTSASSRFVPIIRRRRFHRSA
jgi:hypothetical protein